MKTNNMEFFTVKLNNFITISEFHGFNSLIPKNQV